MTSTSIPAPSPTSSRTAPYSPEERPRRHRAVPWALGLALLALIGSLVAMTGVGLTIAPMEAEHGRLLADTPAWYQWAVLGAFGSLLLWTVSGIVSIVLAVIGLGAGQGKVQAIIAIALAVTAPVLALGALIGALLAGTALI